MTVYGTRIFILKEPSNIESLKPKEVSRIIRQSVFCERFNTFISYLKQVRTVDLYIRILDGQDPFDNTEETVDKDRIKDILADTENYLKTNYNLVLKNKSFFKINDSARFIRVNSTLFDPENIEQYAKKISVAFPSSKILAYAEINDNQVSVIIIENSIVEINKTIEKNEVSLFLARLFGSGYSDIDLFSYGSD